MKDTIDRLWNEGGERIAAAADQAELEAVKQAILGNLRD